MILVICPRPIRCFASLKSALVDPKPSASMTSCCSKRQTRGFWKWYPKMDGLSWKTHDLRVPPFQETSNCGFWVSSCGRNPEITQPSLCCTLRESNVAIENPPFRDDVPFTGDIPATFHYQCVYHIPYTL